MLRVLTFVVCLGCALPMCCSRGHRETHGTLRPCMIQMERRTSAAHSTLESPAQSPPKCWKMPRKLIFISSSSQYDSLQRVCTIASMHATSSVAIAGAQVSCAHSHPVGTSNSSVQANTCMKLTSELRQGDIADLGKCWFVHTVTAPLGLLRRKNPNRGACHAPNVLRPQQPQRDGMQGFSSEPSGSML